MEVDREELLGTLNILKAGLAGKEVLEQSTCFVFIDGRIYTYNDEIALSADFDIELRGAIPARELLGILAKAKDGTLTIKEKNGEVLLSGKRVKAGLRIEKEIALPIDELEIPEEFTELPSNFKDAVSRCLASVGSDMNKPALTCVHIHKDIIESCDAYRLTRFKLSKKAKKAFPESFLLPAAAARALLTHDVVSYGLVDSWVHFRTEDGVLFSARIYDIEYPDLSAFLHDSGTPITFPTNITELIDRVAVFAAGDFKQDEFIELRLENNWVTIAAKNDYGWMEDKERVKFSGEPAHFLTSPALMIDILKTLKSAEMGSRSLKFIHEDYVHVVSLIPKMSPEE